ncbi:thioredoxin domain-containing protein [Priestia megaterium]|uniref:thioredoxin family protein n=1 Tax=Priestia megaterium TaxID=1404 RepID=UPI0021ABD185|nr:thioredoxin domain-containing protein [Priestia megaterium]MCR8928828.1 thioredoxin domain-containing protein [Priestia megaterium]
MAIVYVENGELEQHLQTDKVVLLNFTATWCGPCNYFAPTLEELDKQLGDQVQIVKVDINKNEELAQEFGVMSIPNSRFYYKNKFGHPFMGIVDLEEMKKQVLAIKEQ